MRLFRARTNDRGFCAERRVDRDVNNYAPLSCPMNRLLVCLDASRARRHRRRDLARRSAKLSLFRAVRLPDLSAHVVGVSPGTLLERLEQEAREGLADYARKVPPELLGSSHVAVGSPWDAICREAARSSADLVVIGSHGYGGLDRVIGTTAAKVVNHCDRSVLVVR